jgi:hypothetical protein
MSRIVMTILKFERQNTMHLIYTPLVCCRIRICSVSEAIRVMEDKGSRAHVISVTEVLVISVGYCWNFCRCEDITVCSVAGQ